MAGRGLDQIVRYLSRTVAVQQNGNVADPELLERFFRTRDGAAFEVLVWRHGSMVLNLCQRVTGREQDAEDAFQATFLAFARRGQAIGKRDSISSWLYKVAFRAALEVKRRASRFGGALLLAIPAGSCPVEEVISNELRSIIDEEILRLAERYRAPLILSCFQGKTNREIANELHCPEATIRTRLSRARERLRQRLDSRGFAETMSTLGLALAPCTGRGTSASLVSSTLELVADPGQAVHKAAAAVLVAKKVQQMMILQTLKQAAAVIALMVSFGGLTAFSAHEVLAARFADVHEAVQENDVGNDLDDSKDDRKAIVGTWESSTTEWISTTNPGKPPVVKEVLATIRWVVTSDKIFVVGEDGFINEEYEYKLETTKRPKAIELVSRIFGPRLGIYELAGNTLKVSLGSKTERPAKLLDTPEQRIPVFLRISSQPAKVEQRYPNAPGCYWMVAPTGAGGMMATLGITFVNDEDKDGAAVIILAYASSVTKAKRLGDYRPVLLDSEGRRYLPKAETGGASSSPDGDLVSLQRWRMDPKILPMAKVKKIGIEAVTAEATRLIAVDAADRARKAGIECLAWPQIGDAYPLELTTVDGQKLSSKQFQGKVVVVDCWATWCGPCMRKMPELKRIYEKWHKDGLEIVGINLDRDIEILRKAVKSQGLSWPQVLAPTDEKSRELWQQAAGLESLPRILLIDRAGKLRVNTPAELEEKIGELVKEGVSGR